MGPAGRFGRQSGLAHAGFAGDEDGPPDAGGGLLPRVAQQLDLGRPAREAEAAPGREQRGEGEFRPHRTGLLPADLEGADGLNQSLQLEVAHVGEAVASTSPGQGSDEVGGQDLPAAGGGAQAGGLDDRGAHAVAVLLHGDVAGGEAGAQGQSLVRVAAAVEVGGLLDGDGARHRFGGAGEAGQDPVAESLHHHAAVGLHGVAQEAVVEPVELVGRLLAQARPHLRGPHQIGDQDRGGRQLASPCRSG